VVVKNNKNSFSVDVVASFAPQSSQRGRPQLRRKGKVQSGSIRRKGKVESGSTPRRVERRRSVHLPRPVSVKRGRSLNFERNQQPVKRSSLSDEESSREDVFPYFESARV
jgi:hypothetical protein